MKIAYFDIDSAEADQVRAWLDEAGHDCERTGDTRDLEERLRQKRFDVALINWDVEGLDHYGIVSKASRKGDAIPVLVASETATRDQIADTLKQENCEFISRPLDREEFLARLDTIWEHMGLRDATPEYSSRLGPWEVEWERREILLHGKPVSLTDKDFEVASFFFRNLGKLLTRRELLREIWGINAPVETRTVDVHVSRIRKSLEIDGRHGYHIRTVYQHGYRLERIPE